MRSERGTQRAVVFILGYALLLWSLVAMASSKRSSLKSVATKKQSNKLGVVINGAHYVIDTTTKLNGGNYNERIRIVHSAPSTVNRHAKADAHERKSQQLLRGADTTSSSQTNRSILPQYAWIFSILFHFRRFIKRRQAEKLLTYDDDFFVKSGLESNLEYGRGFGLQELDDDYLSVDRSFYGSMSNYWSSDELDKFDASSQNSDDEDACMLEI